MSRAVSTVLDASLAVLLVSAAVVALVAIPGDDPRPADPDAAARTVLASTATATYQTDAGSEPVTGRVGTLLAHAAVADRDGASEPFVDAVESAVGFVVQQVDGDVAVVAVAGDGRVRAGDRAPPSASVAAVSHEVDVGDETATVTVRTWSA
ncbi:DUF7284 family protein [Halobacterium yunchengense]|uniref:DUF7284 family protein n=1 Tax=Halobacterium yunchengense TaxID=3108497 RepID=UPI003008E292